MTESATSGRVHVIAINDHSRIVTSNDNLEMNIDGIQQHINRQLAAIAKKQGKGFSGYAVVPPGEGNWPEGAKAPTLLATGDKPPLHKKRRREVDEGGQAVWEGLHRLLESEEIRKHGQVQVVIVTPFQRDSRTDKSDKHKEWVLKRIAESQTKKAGRLILSTIVVSDPAILKRDIEGYVNASVLTVSKDSVRFGIDGSPKNVDEYEKQLPKWLDAHALESPAPDDKSPAYDKDTRKKLGNAFRKEMDHYWRRALAGKGTDKMISTLVDEAEKGLEGAAMRAARKGKPLNHQDAIMNLDAVRKAFAKDYDSLIAPHLPGYIELLGRSDNRKRAMEMDRALIESMRSNARDSDHHFAYVHVTDPAGHGVRHVVQGEASMPRNGPAPVHT